MKKILILFLVSTVIYAQKYVQSPELKPFVEKGMVVMDAVKGDLNGDGQPDAILILKNPKEAETGNFDQPEKRPLLVLVRNAQGKLQVAKRNDAIVMCYHCGGVFGDPYDETTIQNNAFTLRFYGGSRNRWGYDYTFQYQSVTKNWLLVKEVMLSHDTLEPDKEPQKHTVEGAECGGVTIEAFKMAEDNFAEWQVAASKTFFHHATNPASQRKAFLLKGDKFSGIRETPNYVYGYFTNAKEKTTQGFILKKDLKKTNP
ncbi:MAG: hypothetical protein MUE30_09400 [Spirosomaceae bacterium]|jgi:hypothetical protein|nr:hypothetical protein [Spirosomataceae bacterium]